MAEKQSVCIISCRDQSAFFDIDVYLRVSPQNGTADAASMFADDIYAAGFCHGLELAAGESHNGVGQQKEHYSEQQCKLLSLS